MATDPINPSLQLHPAKILRQVASPVGQVTENIRVLAEHMERLMKTHEGIGLAAPQVGHSLRLFVTRDPDDPESDAARVFIDPVMTVVDPEPVEANEGCLSLPGIEVNVRRPLAIQIEATDLSGARFTEVRDDHFARVYQHEFDHLEGVLIIDRMNTMDRLKNRRLLRDLERS